MIANKNEAKTMKTVFSVIVNADSLLKHIKQIKNGTIKHINVILEIIVSAKVIIVGVDLITCICENSKYLKSIADDSAIVCDEIIDAIDIVSTKLTNTLATNVTKKMF